MMWWAWALLALAIGVSLLGYWLGWRDGLRQGRRETREDLERIEPPPRTPGQPTNRIAPPSRVRDIRGRRGRMNS